MCQNKMFHLLVNHKIIENFFMLKINYVFYFDHLLQMKLNEVFLE